MSTAPRPLGRVREILAAFFALGLTAFGGPIAHLAYFRAEFVERRRWLSDRDYADLVALCQFLPGPASSQVGFALGLLRGGAWGGIAAWTAFTLPSAMVLLAVALSAASLDGPIGSGIFHGLKVAAVAIVAHAVWGMARTLCPDRERAGIALAAAVAVVLAQTPAVLVAVILAGALGGVALCRGNEPSEPSTLTVPLSRKTGAVAAGLFLALLVLLPLLAWAIPDARLALIDAVYRAGALVFGGGHVVLPLLEVEFVQSGRLSADDFLAGYGAAQAVPGPLFTFAAYLGAMTSSSAPTLTAALALVTIFVPGLLLVIAALPYWNRLQRWHRGQAMLRGANAAVVGILGATLYDPLWTGVIAGPAEFALALTGFLLLSVWKMPAWAVVALMAIGGLWVTLHPF